MTFLYCVKWLLVLFLTGMIGMPFCFCCLRNLPGRGFAFSRSAGLILTGFLWWLGCTLCFLKPDVGSLLMVLLICAAGAFLLFWKNRKAILLFLRDARCYCLSTELVFLIGFVFMICMRLGGPEVSGTEKPMEMMFINGILRSDTFPPNDAWLSGYSISYYYFGYIMTAMLIRLSSVPSEVGFNLMLASVFALAAVSAFSLLNDMLLCREGADSLKARAESLLAPFFVLLCGNGEGLFEVLHSLHLFWNTDGTSPFWTWLNLKELTVAPARDAVWDPTGRSGIWWWRASRVLSDTALNGNQIEVIDEFPMFSFQLGDLHPHVLGIPFVIFAAAIAFNALLRGIAAKERAPFFIEGIMQQELSFRETAIAKWLCSGEFCFSALCIGALIFINTWDFPFYFGLYCLCVTAAYIGSHGWDRSVVTVLFETALPLGLVCILLYGLFLTSLSSQAGGIVPSGLFSTRLIQFLMMFGLFLVPILWWLIRKFRSREAGSRRFGIRTSLLIFIALLLIETLLVLALLLTCNGSIGGTLRNAAEAFAGVQGITDPGAGIAAFFRQRLLTLPTCMILFGMAAGSFMLLHAFCGNGDEKRGTDLFCGLLVLIASALAIFCEFFYLRDFFGTRMNTVFKFYFQAWILFALSAGYCTIRLWKNASSRVFFRVVTVLLILIGVIYPFFCIRGKVGSMRETLDGAAWFRRSRADEWGGIEWLRQAEFGVILEKVGASYSSDNSASVFSGLPAIQGPANHESQWRGGYTEMAGRSDDVRTMFETRDWDTAKKLLDKYHVRYVYIGSAERNEYSVQQQKFDRHLSKVYDSNGCTIYQVY